ncbi:MAG: glutamate racemase [Burkholderiales bacterium]
MNTDSTSSPCIGVFDSGVGGLSILRALHHRLASTSMIYVGDVANAPYGERAASEVIARSMRIVEWLAGQGATMIVVACNTATVLAIEALRARWPTLVFVGVEPGVKPAAARSCTRRIAVMVTAATATSGRLQHLITRYASDAHVHVQTCIGLADAIERGALDGPALFDVLRPFCAEVVAANVDTVVLGCTHYPFVEESIRALLGPDITLIDTASAIADRAASLWEQTPAVFEPEPHLRAMSTGTSETMRVLLRRCPGLEDIEIESLDA